MKKIITLLGVLGSLSLGAVTTISVVSCHFGDPIRVPKDLSQFTEGDFEETFVKWIAEGKVDSKEEAEVKSVVKSSKVLTDVKGVITSYFTKNNVAHKDTDISIKVTLNGIVLDDNAEDNELSESGFSIKIEAWASQFNTQIINSLNLNIDNFKLNILNMSDFVVKLNELTLLDYTKVIKNIAETNYSELVLVVETMINETLKNHFGLNSPISGTDYYLKFGATNSDPKDAKYDLYNNGTLNIKINLKLHDWKKNKWLVSGSDEYTLEINNQKMVFAQTK